MSVPRIVDDDLFARAQRRIQQNRRFAARRLRRKGSYLLRGLLKCGVCGHAYLGFTQISRSKYEGPVEYPLYRCTMRNPIRTGRLERCTSVQLMGAGVDEIVWTTVRDLLLSSELLAARLEAWLTHQVEGSVGEDRLKAATQRLSELRRQRQRLIDAYQAGVLDLKDFAVRKTSLEGDLQAVEHDQAELRSHVVQRDLAIQQVAGARAIVARLQERLENADFSTKQVILRLAVERVVVTGHRLEIHLALPVSGNFDLTSGWGANPNSFRNQGSLVNRRAREGARCRRNRQLREPLSFSR